MQTESINESVLNPLVLPRHNQKKDPSKIPFVLSRYNPWQKKIKKRKSKNESVKRLRKKSVIFRERFFDSSSVAAGSQSAMQQ